MPNNQTDSKSVPLFDELEFAIDAALTLVRREATNQWLMEVIQPGDKQWHTHDMTQEVMSLKRLIQAREQAAYDRGIDEAYKHLYTASQVSEAIRRALLSKTNAKMINAVIEDVGDELRQLGQGNGGGNHAD